MIYIFFKYLIIFKNQINACLLFLYQNEQIFKNKIYIKINMEFNNNMELKNSEKINSY